MEKNINELIRELAEPKLVSVNLTEDLAIEMFSHLYMSDVIKLTAIMIDELKEINYDVCYKDYIFAHVVINSLVRIEDTEDGEENVLDSLDYTYSLLVNLLNSDYIPREVYYFIVSWRDYFNEKFNEVKENTKPINMVLNQLIEAIVDSFDVEDFLDVETTEDIVEAEHETLDGE